MSYLVRRGKSAKSLAVRLCWLQQTHRASHPGYTMPKYVLALDQGTTSSRAIVFDRRGAIVASAQKEFRQIFPQPGWVEHDAGEIWSTQLECAQIAVRQAGATSADVAAIGITNQRETVVLWDRASGTPVANAIVWQDRRTADRCAELKERGLEEKIRAKTGLVLDPYFSATKLGWLLDHVPGARARAERGELAFGTVDSWLVWNLTAGREHVTDVSNASRTLLLDLATLDWDDGLLALFGVPRAVLPRVTRSSEVFGTTTLFGGRIAIAGNAGDQQAATFGQACFTPGMAKNTYGTGAFMLLNVGSAPQPSANRLLSTAGWTLANGDPPTCLKEACSWRERWCSGCATGSACSRARMTSKPLRGRCRTPAESCWCRLSSDSALRTGTRMHAERSSA
jgi:glycerol kinase